MYKPSRYNFFVPQGERIIYFNALKGSSFTLSPTEHERMQRQLADPISFELGFPSVFRQFKSLGFVVDEACDELDEFRFKYHEKAFNDRHYHLTLACGQENDLDLYVLPQPVRKTPSPIEFREQVKRHIRHMLEKERIDSLCLEWTGGEPLLHFDEWIEPVCREAKQECQKHGIGFHAQIATNGLLLETVANRLETIGIRCVKVTIEDSEAKHDKIRHDKGKPTFRRIVENIIRLCKEIPAMQVELEIRYDTASKNESIQKILDFFPANVRDNITLDCQEEKQATHEIAVQRANPMESLNTQGFDLGLSEKTNRWAKRGMRRLYQRTMLPGGEFYWDVLPVFPPGEAIGQADEKTGEMTWNEDRSVALSAFHWFENNRCRECKLLPQLSEQCGKLCNAPDKRLTEKSCLLKMGVLNPELWVVKSFEVKNALIALNIKQ